MSVNIGLVQKVAGELNVKPAQVAAVIQLLFTEECTIPFVARYRKEMTGSLDEVALRDIRDRYHYLTELETQKGKYLKVVEEHCQKNPAFKGRFEELKAKFEACTTRQELEDLYLPFKPKRRTRAQIAREKGLEPLLEQLLDGQSKIDDPMAVAQAFVTPEGKDIAPELRVPDAAAALAGAADILAERVNETAPWRALVRQISMDSGFLVAKRSDDGSKSEASAAATTAADAPADSDDKPGNKKKSEAAKFENYFDYKEPLKTAPSHRVMAVRRGEAEKVLRVSVEVDEERILAELRSAVASERSAQGSIPTDAMARWLGQTVDDAYKRLMGPSIETELRMLLKQKAEEEAIGVFSKNLENLLLLPPIPGKTVLGVDPGIRTGSKLAVVDETGKLLASETIYPDYRRPEHGKNKEAKVRILDFVTRFAVQYIAIGNGTGSREIDRFVSATIKEAQAQGVAIGGLRRVVVNEAGASVYSTDEIGREEFPDLDATIRSAISIARRLQDPLGELVKINPRSIGVGQYQHDVNPTKLGRSLEEVVESCVNKVGVNLNTASYKLLGYVSGVGPTLAKNIVQFRNTNGRFQSREQVLKVIGFGPKAYQQAAGFLRVPEAENPLDNSAVHPERYEIVEMIAKDMKVSVRDLIGKGELVRAVAWERYVSQTLGLPTLKDIESELMRPGRDPREDGSRLTYSDEVSEITDLKPGMPLKGTVTNVTAFGAFVDIGVHQDGLVHISELSDNFVKDPAEVVAVGTIVDVKVIDVDVARRRISLTCRSQLPSERQGPPQRPQNNEARDGRPEQQGGRGGRGQDQRGGQGQQRNGAYHGGGRGQQQGRGGHQGGGHQGAGRGGQHGGGGQRPKAPEKNHTLEDLLNKFGKR